MERNPADGSDGRREGEKRGDKLKDTTSFRWWKTTHPFAQAASVRAFLGGRGRDSR